MTNEQRKNEIAQLIKKKEEELAQLQLIKKKEEELAQLKKEEEEVQQKEDKEKSGKCLKPAPTASMHSQQKAKKEEKEGAGCLSIVLGCLSLALLFLDAGPEWAGIAAVVGLGIGIYSGKPGGITISVIGLALSIGNYAAAVHAENVRRANEAAQSNMLKELFKFGATLLPFLF